MSGINIPQILLAIVEGFVVTDSLKKSLIIGASVGLSNFVTTNIVYSTGEKYVVEPAVAGVLNALGVSLTLKDGSALKNFGIGFVVGGSSAGIVETALYRNYKDSAKLSAPVYQQVRDYSALPASKSTYAGYGIY